MQRVEDLAKVSPHRQAMPVVLAVPGHDYWPLPWYLRKFENWQPMADLTGIDSSHPPPGVIVTGAGPEADASGAWLSERYTVVDFFELRPSVVLPVYVENGLWAAFLETRK
jgi:predicted membrane-bound mannosyltransferase